MLDWAFVLTLNLRAVKTLTWAYPALCGEGPAAPPQPGHVHLSPHLLHPTGLPSVPQAYALSTTGSLHSLLLCLEQPSPRSRWRIVNLPVIPGGSLLITFPNVASTHPTPGSSSVLWPCFIFFTALAPAPQKVTYVCIHAYCLSLIASMSTS